MKSSVFGHMMTLHIHLQQNGDEDKVAVNIAGRVFQQYKTSICVRGILSTVFGYAIARTRILTILIVFSYFRNLRDNNLSTLSWRTFQNFNTTLP